MTRYDCFALSKCGAESSENEDFAIVDASAGVFLVADGVGGRPGGARASRAAAESFVQRARAANPLDDERMLQLVQGVNDDVRALGGPSTTLTAIVMNGLGRGRLAHVGDSRAYHLRGESLEQLTRDHTLVAEMLEHHQLTPEVARRHALRNVLSRSIGGQERVEPQITGVELAAGEWLILATDGVTKSIDDETLRATIAANRNTSAEEMCRSILAVTAASDDDASVAAVRLRENT